MCTQNIGWSHVIVYASPRDYKEVAETGKMIYFKGEIVEIEGRSHLLAQGLPNALTDQDFNLGVITRDLFHLFLHKC